MAAEKFLPLSALEFGRVFALYRPRFEVIARRYVRNATVAEDIVSDSFMAFWESREKLPATLTESSCPAYILTIVRNRCLDWLRAQSRHQKIEQEVYRLQQRVLAADIRSLQAFDPREIFSEEVADIVRQALDALPALTREVFIARRFADLSYRDISLQCGISERRVEFELEKAAKHLRVALKDYLPALLILLAINTLKS